jgi:DUF971 family protein
MAIAIPTELKLHKADRQLEISFDNGKSYSLSCEYLRIFSPSAEVRGHGPGQEVLQAGKKDVSIENITPVGNYAVCLHFSDGHNSGLYDWDTLLSLAINQNDNWQSYLARLEAAGLSREAAVEQH